MWYDDFATHTNIVKIKGQRLSLSLHGYIYIGKNVLSSFMYSCRDYGIVCVATSEVCVFRA